MRRQRAAIAGVKVMSATTSLEPAPMGRETHGQLAIDDVSGALLDANPMRYLVVFLCLGGSLASVPTRADAAVLCARKKADGSFNAAVKIRETCKASEETLDTNALGLQGPPGPRGPAGPDSPVRSKVVAFSRSHLLGDGPQAIVGVGFQPTTILLWCAKLSANGTIAGAMGAADEAGYFRSVYVSAGDKLPDGSLSGGDGFATDPSFGAVNPTGSTGSHVATLESFDSDGFTLNWTLFTSPTFDVECHALALR